MDLAQSGGGPIAKGARQFVMAMALNPLIASLCMLRLRGLIQRGLEPDDAEYELNSWLADSGFATTAQAVREALAAFGTQDLGWWRGIYRLRLDGRDSGALAISHDLGGDARVSVNGNPIAAFHYEADTLSWSQQGSPPCSASLRFRVEGDAPASEMRAGSFGKALSGVMWADGASRPDAENCNGFTNVVDLGAPHAVPQRGSRRASLPQADGEAFFWNGTYKVMTRATGSETYGPAPDLTVKLTKRVDPGSKQAWYAGTVTYGYAQLAPQQFGTDPAVSPDTVVNDCLLSWSDEQNTMTRGKLLFSLLEDGRKAFTGAIRHSDDHGSGPNASGCEPKAETGGESDGPGTIAAGVLAAAAVIATAAAAAAFGLAYRSWQGGERSDPDAADASIGAVQAPLEGLHDLDPAVVTQSVDADVAAEEQKRQLTEIQRLADAVLLSSQQQMIVLKKLIGKFKQIRGEWQKLKETKPSARRRCGLSINR